MEILILDYFVIEPGVGEIQLNVTERVIVEGPEEINKQLTADMLLLSPRCNLHFLQRSQLKITIEENGLQYRKN